MTKRKNRPVTGAGARCNPHWRVHFLERLAQTSNVSDAARHADIDPSTAYNARRREPRFRACWYQALLEGYEHLEMETVYRLRMGTAKDAPNYDIPNTLRLLGLHRETVARERALREEDDEDAILASLDAKIDAMREREAQAARLLAEDVTGDRQAFA